MIWKKTAAVLLTICMLLSLGACAAKKGNASLPGESSADPAVSAASAAESLTPAGEGILAVHYLDVGQGDSVFLELPNGQCMLIDASESVYSETIIATIRALSYDRIDYVIATHPHADHIGGMEAILKAFSIGCIYMPDASASTATYIGMAETILDLDIEAKIAERGVEVLSEGALQAAFLAPSAIDESDQNRNSAVLLLTYGKTRFLFMGDADTTVEDSLSGTIACDVLKVGHHGSRTASGTSFLLKAAPTYAVISCGRENSYGHPHKEAVQRLENSGAKILRTDLSGTITIRSDGIDLTVEIAGVQQEPTESSSGSGTERASWVLNTSSKKIHRPDCKNVDAIAERNRKESDLTIAELMKQGYTACGACKPSDGTE